MEAELSKRAVAQGARRIRYKDAAAQQPKHRLRRVRDGMLTPIFERGQR